MSTNDDHNMVDGCDGNGENYNENQNHDNEDNHAGNNVGRITTTTGSPDTDKDSKNNDIKNNDKKLGWRELMGRDLMIKTIQSAPSPQDNHNDYNKNGNTNDDEDKGEEQNSDGIGIQPMDAVIVDFIGEVAESNNIPEKNNDNKNEQPHQPTNGVIFQRAKDWLVVVGEHDVIPALEMGIRFMQVGETAVIWSHSKYAYGGDLRQRRYIPENADETHHQSKSTQQQQSQQQQFAYLPTHTNVQFTVTVKRKVSYPQDNDENENNEEVSAAEFAMQRALAKKEIGNDVYANEWSHGHGRKRAIQLYTKAAEQVEYLAIAANSNEQSQNDDDNNHNMQEIKQRAKQIYLDCLNNIVAACLRAHEYHAAKQAAVAVLTHDPDNVKALLRAAKASLLDPASTYDEVEAAICAAEQQVQANSNGTDNDNTVETMETIRKLKAEFKQKKKEYERKSKEMFSKALGNNNNNNSTGSSNVDPKINEQEMQQEQQEQLPQQQQQPADSTLVPGRPMDTPSPVKTAFPLVLLLLVILVVLLFLKVIVTRNHHPPVLLTLQQEPAARDEF